ncbi:hypothetical protein V6N11_082607 [Hibiscus sabdariffa]|uniref:Uncharacterized protein n=1 Tax=Hibiscus sabdariffa TaxID=183260 RepID=A0ABR1Z9Y5_9ROSI
MSSSSFSSTFSSLLASTAAGDAAARSPPTALALTVTAAPAEGMVAILSSNSYKLRQIIPLNLGQEQLNLAIINFSSNCQAKAAVTNPY